MKTIKTNYIEEYHQLDGELEEFTEQVNQLSPYHLTQIEARQEREKILLTIRTLLELERIEDEDGR